MGYFLQFETFNPVSSVVPSHPFSYMSAIADRARALLKSRTAEQIDSAAMSIDWAIDQYFQTVKEEEIERLRNEVDNPQAAKFFYWEGDRDNRRRIFNRDLEDELEIATEENTSEVDVLKECIDWWDDFVDKDFPDGKLYEYFAVLSLWLIADAMEWLHYRRSETPEGLCDHILAPVEGSHAQENDVLAQGQAKIRDIEVGLSVAGKCALKAMDAVCHAEHLRDLMWLNEAHSTDLTKTHNDYMKREEERQKEERKRRSMRSQTLNIARHRKDYEAKAKAIEEWQKDKTRFKSAEKAGLYLADWLNKQGFVYEPRTVTGWIRAYARQIGEFK